MTKNIIVIGFALFAMFFGAGNLIFPPYLGMTSGSSWILAFISYFLADIGLALVAVVAMLKAEGSIENITNRVGKLPSLIIATSVIVCVGPLLAIPRTAATTFEMAVLPIFGDMNNVLFSFLFFLVVTLLTIKPSKVVDIIGKFLTPVMFIALLILIMQGVITPIGPISQGKLIENVVANGVLMGYQTMDALGALAFAIIIISTVIEKGYVQEKEKMKVVAYASMVAGVGLFIVYFGLTYLGATVSTLYGVGVNQASLLVDITRQLLGFTGTVILAIVVGLACLTTAIGLTSASGAYFAKLSKGKIKYETIVIGIGVFSMVVSNFGITEIIKFSTPILNIVYPAAITLIFLSFFDKKIKNNYIFKGATLGAIVISILTVFNSYTGAVDIINKLPFASLGFQWVIPAILFGFVGSLIKK